MRNVHGTLVLCRICSSACKANGNEFYVLCKFVVLIQSTLACFLLSLAHLEGILKRLSARIPFWSGECRESGPLTTTTLIASHRTPTLHLHQDDHGRALSSDSAASISPFVKNLHKTTTIVAHRGPIRFGVFLASAFNLIFRSTTSCGRHIDRRIRNPRSQIYARIVPGQSRSIHNSGSLCGKHLLPVSSRY
jgi:hypothetical protein